MRGLIRRFPSIKSIKNMRRRVKMNDDGIHRVEIPEVPVEAIREAVINSFAHARYDNTGTA